MPSHCAFHLHITTLEPITNITPCLIVVVTISLCTTLLLLPLSKVQIQHSVMLLIAAQHDHDASPLPPIDDELQGREAALENMPRMRFQGFF